MTLITSIGDSIGAVTWTNTEHSVDKIYFGYLLKKYVKADIETEMDYQNDLATKEGYTACLQLRQLCDMFGETSTNIDDYSKIALNGLAMLGTKHLPFDWTYSAHDYFLLYDRFLGHAYWVAKQLEYLESKWDHSLAWQEFKVVRIAAGHEILAADPRDNSHYAGSYPRTYDEGAEGLDILLQLYEIDKPGNAGALTYARDTIWPNINTLYWDVDHYEYCADWGGGYGYECEGACLPLVFGKLRALNGFSLVNWDNVLTDIKSRFLNNGWYSPQWCDYNGSIRKYVVIHHYTDNSKTRLENTFAAWVMLHAYYQLLDSTSKTNMITLLDDTIKAWTHLISDSPLYDASSKTFRMHSDLGLTDPATATGIALMFLMGIVPQSGSLFVPLYEFAYQGSQALNKYFSFDYTNRVIRIPVKSGDIKFIFGSSPVTQSFAENAYYDITFAADWNSITNVTKVGALDTSLLWLEVPEAGIIRFTTAALGVTSIGKRIPTRIRKASASTGISAATKGMAGFIITTLAADEITANSAKLHGEVSQPHGARGFEWGKVSGNLGLEWNEVGTYNSGYFEHTVADLDPNTTYYFRAKAHR